MNWPCCINGKQKSSFKCIFKQEKSYQLWKQIGNEDNQQCQQLSLITKPKMINSFQQQQSEIIPRNIKKQINQCQFCPQRFKNYKALGGHISKKHKGSSKKYNQKMRSYKRNTQTRFNRRILTKHIRSLFGFEEQVDQ